MGRCITPFTKENNQFPCGKCFECISRRISTWSYRLLKEAERSLTAHFITLTYKTEELPRSKNKFKTLRKRDLQLFMKRLRKISQNKLKFYAAGEYGEEYFRPHYHIILFNAEVNDVEKAWQKGQIHYGKVNEATVGYTLKYISKKSRIPMHQNDDRLPEFSVMSKRLGDNYLTENKISWHKKDWNKTDSVWKERMYIPLKDGKKIALPRYYKDKIYTQLEKKVVAQHMVNIEAAKDINKSWKTLKEEREQRIRVLKEKQRKSGLEMRISKKL